MINSNIEQLQEKLDCLVDNLEAALRKEPLILRLKDLTSQQVNAMTGEQAEQYLKTTDDANIGIAYHVLFEKLEKAKMSQICLDFLRRPGKVARNIGAFGLGTCFKGAGNENWEISRALAQMIRNTNEETDTRLGAYLSLVLIHSGKINTSTENCQCAVQADLEFGMIDWCFVDSFL